MKCLRHFEIYHSTGILAVYLGKADADALSGFSLLLDSSRILANENRCSARSWMSEMQLRDGMFGFGC